MDEPAMSGVEMQQVTSAHAFQVRDPGHGEIVRVDLPPVADGMVRVRTKFSGISRGTESLVFRGEVPQSQVHAMRAPFQSGDFPGPVIYGYSNVGRVQEGPAELKGQDVFCLFPHQTRYVVPVDSVVPLPAGLPASRAVLAANMETAINALWDAAPVVGDRISIIGAGVVGCLVAALCARLPGTEVELIDIDPARAAIAEWLGAHFRDPGAAAAERDLVVHASASTAGARRALQLAGFEATVLELSWFGTQEVSLPLGEAFHARRLQLRSSQVGTVSPARRARRGYRERLALALRLLTDPMFDALIDGDSGFDDLPTTMAAIAHGGAGSLCHRVHYETQNEGAAHV